MPRPAIPRAVFRIANSINLGMIFSHLPWVTVFGLSAANSVSALRFADVGLGGFLNGSNFILQHDEAIL